MPAQAGIRVWLGEASKSRLDRGVQTSTSFDTEFLQNVPPAVLALGTMKRLACAHSIF